MNKHEGWTRTTSSAGDAGALTRSRGDGSGGRGEVGRAVVARPGSLYPLVQWAWCCVVSLSELEGFMKGGCVSRFLF